MIEQNPGIYLALLKLTRDNNLLYNIMVSLVHAYYVCITGRQHQLYR